MHNILSEYLDTPVYLKAVHSGQYLHDDGRCSASPKRLVLLSRASGWGNVISIQSVSEQGSFLRVQDCESGHCSFLDNGFELSTQFRVETAADGTEGITFFVISCATGNVLQCLAHEESSFVYCRDQNCDPSKAWMIVFPEEVNSKPSATEITNLVGDDEATVESHLRTKEESIPDACIESKTKEEEGTKLQVEEETQSTPEVDKEEGDTKLQAEEEIKLTPEVDNKKEEDSKLQAEEEIQSTPEVDNKADEDTKLQAEAETTPNVDAETTTALPSIPDTTPSASDGAGTASTDWSLCLPPEGPWRIAAGFALGVAAMPVLTVAANAAAVPLAVTTMGTVVARVGLVAGAMALAGKPNGKERDDGQQAEDIAPEADPAANTIPVAKSTFGSVVGRFGTMAGSFSLLPGEKDDPEDAIKDTTEPSRTEETATAPWSMPIFGSVMSRVGKLADTFSLMEEEANVAAVDGIPSRTDSVDDDETIEFTPGAQGAEEIEVKET